MANIKTVDDRNDDRVKIVSLTEFRKRLLYYISLLPSGITIVIKDFRKNKFIAEMRFPTHDKL